MNSLQLQLPRNSFATNFKPIDEKPVVAAKLHSVARQASCTVAAPFRVQLQLATATPTPVTGCQLRRQSDESL